MDRSSTITKSRHFMVLTIRTLADKAAQILRGMGDIVFAIVRSPCREEAGVHSHLQNRLTLGAFERLFENLSAILDESREKKRRTVQLS